MLNANLGSVRDRVRGRRAGMNVVSLSTYDILGGAARSAWRLHCGLRQSGADATMLCRFKASEDPSVLPVSTPKQNGGSQMHRWANLGDRLIHSNRSDRSGIFFTLPVPGCDLTCHPAVQAADVIHLHWLYSLLSPEGIQRLVNLGKPVVWTLHDQRPFTGGCHFSFGCEGFTGDCAGCPELRDNRAELTPWLLADARRALDPAPIIIVSPSRWLADCARRSTFLRANRVEVIPYGLETNVFRPGDRAAARTALGLDATSLVLLFGADNTSEKRKGFAVLEDALVRCKADPSFARALEDGRIKLLSFGKGSETGNACGLPIQSLGYVSKDEELARIFAASDLLVCPTLDDNLPNVVLEARACGTPVLASRVGGVPELVTPDKNGDLVEPGDARALSAALLRVWREPVRLAQWNAHSRANAGEGFGLEVQAGRYLELYKELLRVPRQAGLTVPAPVDPLPLLPAQWPLSYRETDLGAAAGAASPTPDAAGTWEIRDANLFYAPEQGNPWRPSWGGGNGSTFLSDSHEQIGKIALQWEGWPEENECRKIYEMAFHNGGVILESGCGRGRGAMVALLGALAGRPGGKPQFYGAVPDRAALEQCRAAAEKAGVAEHCLWYIGNAGQLLRDVPIVPTMVVIDGPQADAGALCHLHTLRWILAPGTVVLCRGYPDHAIVRQAVDDVLRTAHFEFLGLFAGSVALRATGACRGVARGLAPETFATLRDQFSTRYMEPSRNGPPPVADLTAGLRGKLEAPARLEPGRGPWPFSAPPSRPLPATLPGGKPWPRITVVTPSFNQGQFLEETLLSVLNQGYPNLEYIVLDGGSTDQSVALLNKYAPRLTFWASEKDRGQCHAINKGFARATGEILTWLNSDDR
ncbi:MAG TPA: glycosyltransferase, partial [Clostridia bacterium]|nr:glycosyltransferase [Clostridia bacterium]